jgi:hypothetical protein
MARKLEPANSIIWSIYKIPAKALAAPDEVTAIEIFQGAFKDQCRLCWAGRGHKDYTEQVGETEVRPAGKGGGRVGRVHRRDYLSEG